VKSGQDMRRTVLSANSTGRAGAAAVDRARTLSWPVRLAVRLGNRLPGLPCHDAAELQSLRGAVTGRLARL